MVQRDEVDGSGPGLAHHYFKFLIGIAEKLNFHIKTLSLHSRKSCFRFEKAPFQIYSLCIVIFYFTNRILVQPLIF